MSTSPKCYLKARASETAAMLKTLDELGCEWLQADRDDLLSIDLNFRPDAYFGTSLVVTAPAGEGSGTASIICFGSRHCGADAALDGVCVGLAS